MPFLSCAPGGQVNRTHTAGMASLHTAVPVAVTIVQDGSVT